MRSFYVCRNIFLAISLALGLASLGLIAHWTQGTTIVGFLLTFEVLGLLVGALTAILFPVLLVISELRKNAYLSYVIVELPLLLVFWVLWLTTGILVNQQAPIYYPFGCDSFFLGANQLRWCAEYFAIGRLTMATFALLLIYWLALLVVAWTHHLRGNPIWTTPVKDMPLFTSASQPSVQAPMNVDLNLQQVGAKTEFSLYSPQMTTPAIPTPTSVSTPLAFTPSTIHAHPTSVFAQPQV